MISDSPGTIALPTSEIGRYAMFTISLAGTMQPLGSQLSVMASASVTENLNAAIRNLRDQDAWVWVIGDDHVWDSNTLMVMLEAMDDNPYIDVLVPLVLKRNPPWHLVLFHSTDLHSDGLPGWRPFEWSEIPETGVFEVDAAGSAGMLIRREVLDELGDPWFESTGGVILNEDVIFCMKARAAGFQVYATADAFMGHLGIFNVRPIWRDGRWGAMTEFSSPEEQYRRVFMPDAATLPVVTVGR